jgi:GNAT superfamily N-acetyltransferase
MLTVRRARPGDAVMILALIRGLAAYERLSHEVKASTAQLRRHGFGRRRYFETLICQRDRQPIGFALYFFTYSTFVGRPSLYLEDLFVVPEERGQGAGRMLLGALARIAIERGCGRMEWAVLHWNRPAIRFYERLGARLRRDWVLTRLGPPAIKRLSAENGAAQRGAEQRSRSARPRGRSRTAGRARR